MHLTPSERPQAARPTIFPARIPSAITAGLLGLTAAGLAGCGDGAAGDAPQALLLSRSNFSDDFLPLPSRLVLMTPSDEAPDGWATETIDEVGAPVRVQLGSAPDGRVIMRRVENGVGLGPALEWQVAGEGYDLVEVADLDAADCEWQKRSNGDPLTKDFERLGGNTFHKAMWFEPAFGEPGILTISANMPAIKMWRRDGEGWAAETLFVQMVGGKEHRYRDIEVGDVDGDGQDELVLATHDRGGVYVLEQTADGLVSSQLHSTDVPYFVHEIELGDVDGDGRPEIFSTPSEPNKFDGEKQIGEILMHDFQDGAYSETTVDFSEDAHAKEILAADIDGDGQIELYSAMESEGLGGKHGVNAEVRRYDFTQADGATQVAKSVVGELPDKMCRFLTYGDTDGDGALELFASTKESGVMRMRPEGDGWQSDLLASGLYTGGFEHSTCVFDSDGDGRDEVYTADDVYGHVFRWSWDDERGRYSKVQLWSYGGKPTGLITWCILPVPLAGVR